MYLIYILMTSLLPIAGILAIWVVYKWRIKLAETMKLRRRQRKEILHEHVGYTLFVTC